MTGGRLALFAGLLAALQLAGACAREPQPYIVMSGTSPDGRRQAEVRLVRCGDEWCHSLWLRSDGAFSRVATLPHDSERAGEIVWTKDGGRVAFLINGHQLRLYEAKTGAPAGLLDLVPADRRPTTRIARGVTFSDNGAAVTFDDCPRARSGCRPGLVAMR